MEIHREPDKRSVQVFELRPFIRRANRIVIMTRGKLNAQDLLCPPDSAAADLCIPTELIKTLKRFLKILMVLTFAFSFWNRLIQVYF